MFMVLKTIKSSSYFYFFFQSTKIYYYKDLEYVCYGISYNLADNLLRFLNDKGLTVSGNFNQIIVAYYIIHIYGKISVFEEIPVFGSLIQNVDQLINHYDSNDVKDIFPEDIFFVNGIIKNHLIVSIYNIYSAIEYKININFDVFSIAYSEFYKNFSSELFLESKVYDISSNEFDLDNLHVLDKLYVMLSYFIDWVKATDVSIYQGKEIVVNKTELIKFFDYVDGHLLKQKVS